MKKVGNFLLSLILPRKMYEHHSMKVIYSVLIFLLSVFIVLFSVNLSTKRFVKKALKAPDFANSEYVLTSDVDFPEYKLVQTANKSGYYLDVTGEEDFKKTYHLSLNKVNNSDQTLDLVIVFDEGCDLFATDDNGEETYSIDPRLINLNSYVNQEFDSNKEYLLFIFTKKSFYYLYNLGKEYDKNHNLVDNSNMAYGGYEKDSNGNYMYYLPNEKNLSLEFNPELDEFGGYDTSKWSMEVSKDKTLTLDGLTISAQRRLKAVYEYYLPASSSEIVKKDDVYDYDLWSKKASEGEKTTIDGVEYTARKKYTISLRNAIYNGEYVYSNLNTDSINQDGTNFSTNDNINECLAQMIDLMVDSDANIQKNMYSLFIIIINVIFPLIWVLVTWLVSRKFVMNKFREYYAICSITYLTTSVVGLILGFFIKFDSLMLILLAIELIYYIFVTFRINTDPKLLNKESGEDSSNTHPDNPGPKEKPEVKFNKIKSDDAYHVE